MLSNLLSSSTPRVFTLEMADKRNFRRPQFSPHMSAYPLPKSQYAYSQSPVFLQSQSHMYTKYSQKAYSQSPMHPQSAYSHPQSDYIQSPLYQIKEPSEPLLNLCESISKQTDCLLSLAKHVISTAAKDTNIVFSPLSIHIVLCMLAAGAGGPTRDQLLSYLKSNSVEELNSLSSQVATLLFADGGPLGGPCLSFADGLWVDQRLNLKPAFKEIVENVYKAATNQVDFRNKADEVIRKEVNAWAEKETNGLIKDLLTPGSVNPDTELILANALFFKGAWADKFDASRTKHGDFFLSNGTPVRVPFMTSQDEQCVSAFDGFKVLSLPYAQGDDNRDFSMHLYLPDTRDGLPALVDQFGSIPGFIERHLPFVPVALADFRVPKSASYFVGLVLIKWSNDRSLSFGSKVLDIFVVFYSYLPVEDKSESYKTTDPVDKFPTRIKQKQRKNKQIRTRKTKMNVLILFSLLLRPLVLM